MVMDWSVSSATSCPMVIWVKSRTARRRRGEACAHPDPDHGEPVDVGSDQEPEEGSCVPDAGEVQFLHPLDLLPGDPGETSRLPSGWTEMARGSFFLTLWALAHSFGREMMYEEPPVIWTFPDLRHAVRQEDPGRRDNIFFYISLAVLRIYILI